MVRIIVVPERLQELSVKMNQVAGELRLLERRLGQAVSALDWQIRRRTNIEGQVQVACFQARALAERAEAMARFLTERAQAFHETDVQSAQNLAMRTYDFLKAMRSVFPEAGLIFSYMTAGRTKMQHFLDLFGIRRYGPLAPWLKIGVLDQRYKFAKTMGKIGVGIGVVSDILTADEINEETVSVAIIRNVGEHLIGTAVPPIGIALAGNALIQLGGMGIVTVSRLTIPVLATSQAMAEDLNTSADQLEAAFKRINLGRITKGISEIVYDLTFKSRFEAIKTFWQQPNLKNLTALAKALNPLAPPPWEEVAQDTKKLLKDLSDFAMGIPDLGLSLLSHTTVMGTALISKWIELQPLPMEWKDKVTQASELVIDYLVQHPITYEKVESAWRNFSSGKSLALPDELSPLSWVNSVQFTPVLVK